MQNHSFLALIVSVAEAVELRIFDLFLFAVVVVAAAAAAAAVAAVADIKSVAVAALNDVALSAAAENGDIDLVGGEKAAAAAVDVKLFETALSNLK